MQSVVAIVERELLKADDRAIVASRESMKSNNSVTPFNHQTAVDRFFDRYASILITFQSFNIIYIYLVVIVGIYFKSDFQ